MQKDVGNLLQSIDNKLSSDEAELNVILTNNLKYRPINEFVLLFAKSFRLTIEDYKLTVTDIRVVFRLMEYAQYGNLLSFDRATLAEDLNLKKQNLSRSLNHLIECGIILKVRNNLFLNPQVISKGSLKRFANARDITSEENLVELGAKVLREKINQGPNIETEKMKKINRKDIKKLEEKIDTLNNEVDECGFYTGELPAGFEEWLAYQQGKS